MEMDCTLKKVANFFKFVLIILEKLLKKIDFSLFSVLWEIISSYFLPVL